jgi:antitoxin component of MazEF toxin-antitoxin module
MADKNDLLEKFVKKKKLQKLSNSLVAIIPKTWIKALNWNQETELVMSLDPEGKKIIIKQDLGKEELTKVIGGPHDGEEVSVVISE